MLGIRNARTLGLKFSLFFSWPGIYSSVFVVWSFMMRYQLVELKSKLSAPYTSVIPLKL